MAKSSPKAKQPKPAPGGKFRDRDLSKVNPLTEQFAPTPAEPIRQHARMAGAVKP